jgi:hypothetical protein
MTATLTAVVGCAAQLALATPAAQHRVPARTIAPVKAAWYDESRPTTSTPKAPEPGVKPHDLVVSGTTVNAAQLPLPLPATLPVLQHVTAFTALSFRIPEDASPATLTLPLTGFSTAKIAAKLPSGVTPVACPTTSAWRAGSQQSIAAAPAYSCKRLSSVGQLSTNGKAIVFPGIGRLVRGHTLSFVVLPGTLGVDRLVFTPPSRKTLSLLRLIGPPVRPVPSIQATTPAPTGTAAAPAPGTVPGGPAVSVPPVPKVSTAPMPGSTPQVATTTQPAVRAAADPLGDSRARTAAIGLLVMLVVVTLWLAVTDTSGRAYTTLRVLRALSVGGPLPEVPAKEWGVGRFRGPRDGTPPTI